MSKSNTNRERRQQVERMRREAQAAERRRTLAIVAACGVVALIIVGIATYGYIQDRNEQAALQDQSLGDIGAAAQAAGCTSIEEEQATGQGQHTSDPVDYAVQPPSYGPHNPSAVESGVHFFDVGERPEVERLVHNLEHGWTMVWYDETIADDPEQMKLLQATAEKFDAQGSDPKFNMIIAPWTEEDGEAIPEGKHLAFTHWSVHQPEYDPAVFESEPESFGQSQYCDAFSGAALDSFMKKYPYDDAPEGYLWHQ